MPDKTPADRTVTAPSDAAPRTADAHSLDALTKRIGGLLQRRAWYQLPRFLAYARLVEIRNELREKNLHDTEEPPLEKQAVPPAGRSRSGHPRGAHDRRDQQRPSVSAHGRGRLPLRPQRAAAAHGARHRQPAGSESADGQPRADDTRTVPAGHDPQPARGSVDSVHGPRLVRPQAIEDRLHRRSDAARRRLRCAPRAALGPRARAGGFDAPARLRQSQQPLVGCLADLWMRSRDGRQAAHPEQRQAAHRADRAACRSIPTPGVHFSGFTDNWWIGLAMLHTLFTLEHNYICDLLAHQNPRWTDEQLFRKAKLINSALMAKIHTIEWTPAIVPNPIIATAMNVNWSGLAGEDLQDALALPRRQGAARRHRRLERRPSHARRIR